MAMGYYFRREVELLYPTALVNARFFSPSFRSNQICYVPKQSRVEMRKRQRHRFPKVYLTRRPAVIAAGSTNISRRENSPFSLDLSELI